MTRKYTIENIQTYLQEEKENVALLSEAYPQGNRVLQWGCTVKGCGHTWFSSPGDLFRSDRNVGCKKCKGHLELTILTIEERLTKENRPIKLLSSTYKNNKTDMKWKCLICEHEWSARADSVITGLKTGCPDCANNLQLTIEEIQDRIKTRPITLLSTDYVNSGSLLDWRCEVCNFHWPAASNNVTIAGQGCPKCGKVHMNITNANRHKDKWVNTPAIVYFIRCWNSKEEFYKIGMTIHTVKVRMYELPYKYEIIKEINTNRYQAVFLEVAFHDKLRVCSYTPQLSFGGETECFTDISEGE